MKIHELIHQKTNSNKADLKPPKNFEEHGFSASRLIGTVKIEVSKIAFPQDFSADMNYKFQLTYLHKSNAKFHPKISRNRGAGELQN